MNSNTVYGAKNRSFLFLNVLAIVFRNLFFILIVSHLFTYQGTNDKSLNIPQTQRTRIPMCTYTTDFSLCRNESNEMEETLRKYFAMRKLFPGDEKRTRKIPLRRS
ncbi:hypothetical protein CDAR_47351 [Caerostris darwini]|uniref:Uncharacterized protein n=1 Tax=Caerostris darwini TaxID=1538125 RepID=A0AAV4RHB2_9ARAC|nr:hypothetical protein CDAR_47351 [Caerostris darwini]